MELKFARGLLTSQNDVKAAFSCTSAPCLQTQLVNSILNHRSASNLFIQTCYPQNEEVIFSRMAPTLYGAPIGLLG